MDGGETMIINYIVSRTAVPGISRTPVHYGPIVSENMHDVTSSANGTVFCFYCLCRCYLMFLVW